MHIVATANRGQEEETGADQKQDGWMTSEEQQVHNGRGRHTIGGNRRHLQRATSCSGWTKPPSNQITTILGHICRHKGLEHLAITGKIAGKRSRVDRE
ncbi:hypothetical protein PoB_001694200 [Plakobranchus ocellatus]|uniref:Uncharacterized protein n=1 Tax=Plakobranchus ocellatus TaxID=259542 RepID=A0AAV3Z597_9GAST|nr:hypothetical protein PoB_001694200 [Plakobranchus ocellatus]